MPFHQLRSLVGSLIDGRGLPPAGSGPGWGRGSIDGRGSPPAGSGPGWGRGSIDGRGSPPAGSGAKWPRRLTPAPVAEGTVDDFGFDEANAAEREFEAQPTTYAINRPRVSTLDALIATLPPRR